MLFETNNDSHTSCTEHCVMLLEMGKNPKFWVRVQFGFFDYKVLFRFWYF